MLAAVALLAALLPAQQTPATATRGVQKIVGNGHFLVLFSDGTVGGWGDMRDGQLGPIAAIPNSSGHSRTFVSLPLPAKAIDIATGGRTSYILLESGSVLALGYGRNGELGCGEPCLKGSETPVPVVGLSDVIAISAGEQTAFAVHRDGTVSGWGTRGVLLGPQDPDKRNQLTPERIPGPRDIITISATGGTHVLALTRAGTVWHWGKLPLGIIFSDDPVIAPHEVPGLTGVQAVVTTGVAAVLKKDGTVWVWGKNEQAQFGNGRRDSSEKSAAPIRVPGVAGVTQLAGAWIGRHFLALLRDGTIKTWGNTDWGQAGTGVTGMEQATPVTSKISGVKAVFAAGNNSFAIRSDGSVWIWGNGGGYSGVWPLGRKPAPLPVPLPLP
ncbi:hypothetical protein F183_A15420 [Bryobacterales bacterium F-183]|nr:hypothetical protein F183_A15420 [Bryobacterales bacterium F-183]